MPASQDPQQNYLLAALSVAERERVFPHLQLVTMPLGKVLYESGDVLRHVYFPTNSIISLLYVLADGASAEISVVGNEGLIGIALFMGGETTPSRAIVQSAGYAYRLVSQHIKEEFHRNGDMQLLLQSPPLGGSAAVPLAAALSRPAFDQSIDHDTGAHRQHARRAPRRGH
jgi:hypothetical protein